jgi:Peptidase S24-like
MEPNNDPADPQYLLELLSSGQPAIWSEWLDPGRHFFNRAEYEKAARSFGEAVEQAEEMSLTAREHGDRIRASALMCLGIVALTEGKLERAIYHYRCAERIYGLVGEYYGQAVSLFARARLLQDNHEWLETPMLYRQSLDLLAKHSGESEFIAKLRENIEAWHKLAVEQFEQSFGEASVKPAETEPARRVDETRRHADGNELASRTDVLPGQLGDKAVLQIARLYPSVAAGPGIWDYPDDKADDFVEANRIVIGDALYEIKSVGTGASQVLRLYRTFDYGACRVEGSSMESAGINDDDYVIFRRERGLKPSAQDNDIVVAAIYVDSVPKGVVKRYRVKKDGIWLESESDTAQMSPILLRETDPGVVGSVVAVLKRI